MTYLHSSIQTPMRIALKQMLADFDATHILTLAFHEQINMARATAKISTWHHHAMHRLFGRRCFQLPANQTIEFLLLPEAGNANLHYHGLIRVPPSHLTRFESYALPHWRRVAQKGTHDFQPIRQTDDEREQWFNYITKGTLANHVLHSSMLIDCQFSDPTMTKSVSAKALPEPVLTRAKKEMYIH